jgi:branched-chain amino acid transport system ATP-binding protein
VKAGSDVPDNGLMVSGLRAGYARVPVLHGIDLTVGPGEFVAVLGPNGAGKTTTLRALMGICTVTGGEMTFNQTDLGQRPTLERASVGVGYVPEGRRVWPSLTVADNLAAGALGVRGRVRRGEIGALTDEVLQIFPSLKSRYKVRAGMLSGGEQQMLAIGRALMSRPRLLLVDEPSIGLAPVAVSAVVDALRALHGREALSVLLVEQRMDIAAEICSRAYVLNRGEVTQSGPMDDLYQTLAASYFGGAARQAIPNETGGTSG